MNLIVSYPHSGDFWVRFIIEYCTGSPTTGPGLERIAVGELYPLGVDLERDFIISSKRTISQSDRQKRDKAIFLVRDYKDVFVRKTFSKDDVDESFYQKTYLDEGYNKYTSVLKEYEDWKGDKFLLYFEDLIDDPDFWVVEMFKFLNISEDLAGPILENYDHNYNCCMEIFSRSYPGSALTAFPETLYSDIRLHMNDIIMYNSPFVFGKYLSRYAS